MFPTTISDVHVMKRTSVNVHIVRMAYVLAHRDQRYINAKRTYPTFT